MTDLSPHVRKCIVELKYLSQILPDLEDPAEKKRLVRKGRTYMYMTRHPRSDPVVDELVREAVSPELDAAIRALPKSSGGSNK